MIQNIISFVAGILYLAPYALIHESVYQLTAQEYPSQRKKYIYILIACLLIILLIIFLTYLYLEYFQIEADGIRYFGYQGENFKAQQLKMILLTYPLGLLDFALLITIPRLVINLIKKRKEDNIGILFKKSAITVTSIIIFIILSGFIT